MYILVVQSNHQNFRTVHKTDSSVRSPVEINPSLLPKKMTSVEHQWYGKYSKLNAFIKEHSRYPSWKSKDPEERILGNWAYLQQRFYAKNKLGAEYLLWGDLQIRHPLNSADFSWWYAFEELKAFVRTNNRYPLVSSEDSNEKLLAQWKANQQKNLRSKSGEMADESKQHLWALFQTERRRTLQRKNAEARRKAEQELMFQQWQEEERLKDLGTKQVEDYLQALPSFSEEYRAVILKVLKREPNLRCTICNAPTTISEESTGEFVVLCGEH